MVALFMTLDIRTLEISIELNGLSCLAEYFQCANQQRGVLQSDKEKTSIIEAMI